MRHAFPERPRQYWRRPAGILALLLGNVAAVPACAAPAQDAPPAEARAQDGRAQDGQATAAPSATPAGQALAPPPSTMPDSTVPYGPPAPPREPVTGDGSLDVTWTPRPPEASPELENAIHLITRNYPTALAARARIRAALADIRTAKWARFPSLSADLSYLDDSRRPEPNLAVDLPLWTAGRIGANIRRARSAEQAAVAGYSEALLTLAVTASDTYFQIARLAREEDLLRDSLTQHQKLVDTMARRVDQEVSPLADLELAKSRAAQVAQDLTTTRSQRLTAIRVLAELIDDADYKLGLVPAYHPDIEMANREALTAEALDYDPTLKRLGYETDTLKHEADIAKAQILPQLNGQYVYSDLYGSRVGVALKMQTSNGLAQFSALESARLRVDAANQQTRVAQQQLKSQMASDVIAYEASRSRASISRGASDAADRVSDSYMRQFIAGRRSWLDMMNALREAVNAQIGQADAEITAMAAAVRLS
ncbi:TolC family protein, partial [Sphingomonas sp.]|uniref:TolC family protein n=1 Tax=Sphingomonas sp. TaxID=28214 RepID=UPI002BEF8DE9